MIKIRDLAITAILMIICTIIGNLGNIDNNIINMLIVLTPIAAPLFTIFIGIPSNYLKFLKFRNQHIQYKYNALYKKCSISSNDFSNIYSTICSGYGNSKVSLLNSLEGDGIYKKVALIGTTPIDIEYDEYDQCLRIEIKDDLNYKRLVTCINKINNIMREIFKEIHYKDSQINLSIMFDNDNEIKNPFINKFFGNLGSNINANLSFQTDNKTQVEISNTKIVFSSKSVEELKEDLSNQLKFIKLKK